MEHDEDTNMSAKGSDLLGAIFMCNRTTKKECFKRKLFGLPSSQAGFVKKVKAGMALFLFEYEERKLYGVFEAASDGIMNCVPAAYSRSGSSFPAQIRFTILWTCRPLSENEFCGAIRENYFAPYKFNFGLSYKQVAKLIELFSSKKTIPRDLKSVDHHSKENYRSVNNDVTGRARSLSFDRSDCDLENAMNLKARFGVNHSRYNENPDPTSGHFNSCIENLSYSRGPSGIQSRLPNTLHSPSQMDYAPEGSFCLSPNDYPIHHSVPSFDGGQPSGVFAAGPNVAQKLTGTQVSHFRSHMYPPYENLEICNSPSTDYLIPDHFYKTGVDNENYGLPFSSDYDLLSSKHGALHVPKESYVDIQNYVDYDPSTSKYYATNDTDSLRSVLGLLNSHGHGYAQGSQERDTARGRRYWDLAPDNSDFPLSENDNLVMNVDPAGLTSQYPSEPCVADRYDSLGDDHYLQGNLTPADSNVHSDAFQERSSVFLRLKAPKSFCPKDKFLDADSAELLKLFSQRKNQWDKMTRVPKKPIACSSNDDDKRLKKVHHMEPVGADSIVELASDHETSIAESLEVPFLNFKRRSGSQNINDATKGSSAESSKDGCKRRKLIRPSFSDDGPFAPTGTEPQNLQSSYQETFSIKSVDVNAKDYANDGTSVLDASFVDREDMNLKHGVEDPGNSEKKGDGTVGMRMKTMDGERILSSKGDGMSIPVSNVIADTSVESGARYLKASNKKFHMGGEGLVLPVTVNREGKNNKIGAKNEKESGGKKSNVNINVESHKISNISSKAGGQKEYVSTSDTKSEGSNRNEICKMMKTSSRNQCMFNSAIRREGNKLGMVYGNNTMCPGIKCEVACFESDVNSSHLGTAIMKDDQTTSDLHILDSSVCSDSIDTDVSIVKPDNGAAVKSVSLSVVKHVSNASGMDIGKEENFFYGNNENTSLPCNMDCPQVTVKQGPNGAEKKFSTAENNRGFNSALYIHTGEIAVKTTKSAPQRSVSNTSHVKSEGQGVKDGQKMVADIKRQGKNIDEAREENKKNPNRSGVNIARVKSKGKGVNAGQKLIADISSQGKKCKVANSEN